MFKILSSFFGKSYPSMPKERFQNDFVHIMDLKKLGDFLNGVHLDTVRNTLKEYSEDEKICSALLLLNEVQEVVPYDAPKSEHSIHAYSFFDTYSQFLKKPLPFHERELGFIIDKILWIEKHYKQSTQWAPHEEIVMQIKHYLNTHPVPSQYLSEKISSLHRYMCEILNEYALIPLDPVLFELTALANKDDFDALLSMEYGDIWMPVLKKFFLNLPEKEQKIWHQIFYFSMAPTGNKPTTKWLHEFNQETLGIPPAQIQEQITFILKEFAEIFAKNTNGLFSQRILEFAKNLLWKALEYDNDDIAEIVYLIAIASYKKLPGITARCLRLGNASVYVLSKITKPTGIDFLIRLQQKIKKPTMKQVIDKAIEEVSLRTGLTHEDMEEVYIPTFQIDNSKSTEKIGNYTAVLEIKHPSQVELYWINKNEKIQATTPSELKIPYKEQIKALKKKKKSIEEQLFIQRLRIERLYLTNRSWNGKDWMERYMRHPLLAKVTSLLVWKITDKEQEYSIFSKEECFITGSGSFLKEIPKTAKVTLWHPAVASLDETLFWRKWIVENEVVQPFKQAFREIYLLTSAEKTTATYSNRFAAHILKQHQFSSLCLARGWDYRLQSNQWDGGSMDATIQIPPFDIRAEYWVEVPHDNDVLSQAGINLYVTTDQVKFFQNSTGEILQLENIPPLIFSEIMRDVDLFVGVASVGNDPVWSDNQRETARTYWDTYSFGELSETATLRKEVVAAILPKLKIANKCMIKDKFLIVQGTIRTYKIHFGSGNILMEPNNQYLCIVKNREKNMTDKIYLPFEGDTTLSLILSKAFLLSEDEKITDESILSQIRLSTT